MPRQGYSGARPDVLRLIPQQPRRILDVGCGAGGIGAEIRQRHPLARITGLERDPALRRVAAQHYDHVLDLDLDAPGTITPELGTFDLIIVADVLEHLRDPARVLGDLTGLLENNGWVVTSLPNVRHYSTLCALLFHGRWPRRDRGIHDRTHLHYYTRADILDLLHGAGLDPVREARNLRLIERWSWTNPPARLFDFWPLRPFLTFQYLHASQLRDARSAA